MLNPSTSPSATVDVSSVEKLSAAVGQDRVDYLVGMFVGAQAFVNDEGPMGGACTFHGRGLGRQTEPDPCICLEACSMEACNKCKKCKKGKEGKEGKECKECKSSHCNNKCNTLINSGHKCKPVRNCPT